MAMNADSPLVFNPRANTIEIIKIHLIETDYNCGFQQNRIASGSRDDRHERSEGYKPEAL